MQMVYLKKEKIPISVSSVVLMIVTITYKLVLVLLGLFVLFRFFDLEEKLPAIHEELARRRSQKSTEQ